MTITIHIVENTLLYLSRDGQQSHTQPGHSRMFYGMARACVLFCVEVRSQSLEDVQAQKKIRRGGRANNEWQD